MIDRWRAEQKNLLILDAGDLLYPRVSEPVSQDKTKTFNLQARAIIEAFNFMGCDAITVGEDDFLLGKENLLKVLDEAKFPVVSANLLDGESKATLFRPYVIKTIENLRIGIFGLSPKPDSQDERFHGLLVGDPKETARKVISELKETTDFTVLLSHLGYPKDLELAKELDGINVIVGGHTGINLNYPRIVRNTVILQVANRGRYLGRVDLSINDLSQPFVNVKMKDTLQKRLAQIERRLEELEQNPTKNQKNEQIRERFLKHKAETEKIMKTYEEGNKMVNEVVPLRDTIQDNPECQKILAPYLDQISEHSESSPRSQEASPAQ
ncbi:MAG: hypothetical protein GTO12_23585 [Proteobacteria bacterium]|nr:hypothetical protein [Pseudomonadota bacterium]